MFFWSEVCVQKTVFSAHERLAEAILIVCEHARALREDRLQMFDLTYPGKKSHIPVNVQATYLNIDPSTLSRWRKKGW